MAMFPDLAEPKTLQNVIDLKIIRVITNLQGVVRSFECVDAQGELHEITFNPIDKPYTAVVLDGEEVASLINWKD
jgi:hypothetical protein